MDKQLYELTPDELRTIANIEDLLESVESDKRAKELLKIVEERLTK